MSLFEFLMVMVSIIIGFGMAELMTGAAGMLRNRATTKPYWVHLVLCTAIFIALLQQWWEAWGLQAAPGWTFLGLMLLLGGPIGLFLIAHLLFPDPIEGTDFREYYYGPMRPLWFVAAITVIVGTLFRPLTIGEALLKWDNATSLVFVIAFVIAGMTRRAAVHQTIAPILLVLLLFDVLGWNYAIGG